MVKWNNQYPQEFKTLRWQIRAASEFIHPYQTITWIYQFSMSSIDSLPNVPPYSLYGPGRRRLKDAYLNKPIILGVFWWPYPPNPPGMLVVKGYNFGEQGQNVPQNVSVCLHYTATTSHIDSNGNIVQDRKSYGTQTDVKFVAGLQELWIPFNSIPQIDINAELEVAVRNTKRKVSYYVSNYPDARCDPYFPEI